MELLAVASFARFPWLGMYLRAFYHAAAECAKISRCDSPPRTLVTFAPILVGLLLLAATVSCEKSEHAILLCTLTARALQQQQVCVQLPTYADNVALPAFARRARRCCSNRSISPARRAHSSEPAAAGLLLWAHAGTDGRTPYSFTDPVPHTMRVVPITNTA